MNRLDRELQQILKSYPAEVRRLILYVIYHRSSAIRLSSLEQITQKSRYSLCRIFKKEFNRTPLNWVWLFRVILAKYLLSTDEGWALKEVYLACGFNSHAHFSRSFKSAFHKPPSAFCDFKKRRRDSSEIMSFINKDFELQAKSLRDSLCFSSHNEF